jgi:hypothetical protein
VHKGSTQINKKNKLGFKKKGAKETEGCPGLAHRTVSVAPGPYNSKIFTFGFLQRHSAITHRTVRCATGLSGVPPDCPVHQAEQRLPAQRSTATDTCERYSARTVCTKVRAAARGAPDSEQYLPVPLEDKASTVKP